MPEESFYIWLAGFLDGEGWFGLRISYPNGKERRPYPRISMSVSQSVPNDWIIDEISDKIDGGGVYYSERQSRFGFGVIEKSKKFEIVNWQLYELLPKILPYLKVKKRQAELQYELLSLMKENKGKCQPVEIISKTIEFQGLVSSLNSKKSIYSNGD